MYAERITDSMQRCIDETSRRRELQLAYNQEHGITARSVKSNIRTLLDTVYEADYATVPSIAAEDGEEYLSRPQLEKKIAQLKKDMRQAASRLEFEEAARLRDQMLALQKKLVDMG